MSVYSQRTMNSLVTQLRTIRVSTLQAKEIIGLEYESRVRIEAYGYAVEVEAALRGEPYTREVIHGRVHRNVDTFVITCSDRKVVLRYDKHTLARHSLLIKGFIEDFPEATDMPLTSVDSASVEAIFSTIMTRQMELLTPKVLEGLRYLTPPSDLYYLLFSLPETLDPSFIISIVHGMSDEERSQVVKSYRAKCEYSDCFSELPDSGQGLGIAFAFQSVTDYLRGVVAPEFYNTYPSRVFLILLNDYRDDAKRPILRRFLLESVFNDDGGLFDHRPSCVALLNHMVALMKEMEWKDCVTVLTMIGLRHPLLGNEKREHMGPFQLTIHGHMIYDYVIDEAIEHLSNLEGVPMATVCQLLRPYSME